MVKVAVILSGCGFLDGAEIRESVLALTSLDKHGADVRCFAPDIAQIHVVNHLTNEEMDTEPRSVLVEAARIARGDISPLDEADANDFDALILPGGFGVAKNLSNIALIDDVSEAEILDDLRDLIRTFADQEKPIGAICIAPALLTACLSPERTAHVTLGDAENTGLIEALGGQHQPCQTRGIVIDDANHLVTTSAYMRDAAPLSEVASGIDKLVESVLNQAKAQKN